MQLHPVFTCFAGVGCCIIDKKGCSWLVLVLVVVHACWSRPHSITHINVQGSVCCGIPVPNFEERQLDVVCASECCSVRQLLAALLGGL
jgi:hypothetical protein